MNQQQKDSLGIHTHDGLTTKVCGSCKKTIKFGEEYRESMHYDQIHLHCHNKMIAELSEASTK